MSMTSSPGPAIEYRFNATPLRGSCPVCGGTFESTMGMWPHLARTDQLVCGAPDCPVGEEITGPQPCDTFFEFAALEPRTIEALQDVAGQAGAAGVTADEEGSAGESVSAGNVSAGESGSPDDVDSPGDTGLTVAEQFRRVSLLEDISGADRNVLQLAAIDLQYCQAGSTRIERYHPRLVVRTCGEAAGELLLSGCGEILIEAQ
jgi:hypothetical protein